MSTPKIRVDQWENISEGTKSEQSVDLGVNHADDRTQIFLVARKIVVIDIDDDKLAFVVSRNPGFVALIEALEVVEADAFFIIAATLLDVVHKRRYAGAEVNQ